MFALLLKIAFVANSQTSNDTICLTIKQAKEVLIAAKQKVVLQKRVKSLESDAVGYQMAVAEYKRTIVAQDRVDSSQQEIIHQQEAQKLIYRTRVDYLNKELKKQKVKTKLVAGAGILAVIAMLIITR